MRSLVFSVFLLLMLAGNCFALYKLFTGKQEFLTKFPKLTDTGFTIFRFLPVVNIIALTGMWFLKSWAAYLAIACGLAVIGFDLYFSIYYHLYVAIPATLILLFFIFRYWNHFK
ncbi:MAG: hypothetical protein HZB42_11160 [Sphingobacteriales bacterium]|nr:hypothetical protein [Sphingobacteriales bacterium]